MRPICLPILSPCSRPIRAAAKKIPLDADARNYRRVFRLRWLDRSPITKGQGSRCSRPPRRCRGREIAYQAWEEDRSVDPGVVLAASLTESGCTARWPRSRRVPLCIIFSFPRPACSFCLSPSLSLSFSLLSSLLLSLSVAKIFIRRAHLSQA